MKFKVGDRITIKSVEEIKNTVYEKHDNVYYWYISAMEKYSNKSYIINNIHKKHKEYVELEIEKAHNFKWHYMWIKYNNFFNDTDFMI